MADVRCQMCGKPNPEQNLTCQYCQARLRPVWQAEPETPTPDGISASLPAEENKLPDWLANAPRILDDEIAPPHDLSKLPDWLSQKPDSLEAEAEPIVEAQPAEQLPDWLRTEMGNPPLSDTREPMDLPDWMRELTPLETHHAGGVDLPEASNEIPLDENAAAVEAPLPVTDQQESDIDRLIDDKLQEPEQASGSELLQDASLFDVVDEEQSKPHEAEPSSPEDERLAPAELPDWLESMRPVKPPAVQEQLDDIVPERAGPLAGLRGVLPAEPLTTQIRKPPTYGFRLHATDDQQAHAALFAELINNELAIPAMPQRGKIGSQSFLRIAIALLLILATIAGLTTSLPISAPDFGTEHLTVNRLIENLPTGAAVLLAVEYDPGLSGEMDVIAVPVVNHLMSKGVYLVLVSSMVTGPMQADRLIARANAIGNYDYKPIDSISFNQYTNMGYISGGQTGLLSFAEIPRQVLPLNIDAFPVWNGGPLLEIQKLTDFSLVVVITESPDRARDWIEQVQPNLDETPLLMVLSAQAEPVVRPYVNGGSTQVQAMVANLSGGAAYEVLRGRLSNAMQYWPAFSLGMLVAVVMILIGGFFNAVKAYLTLQAEAAAVRRNLGIKTMRRTGEAQTTPGSPAHRKSTPTKREGK